MLGKIFSVVRSAAKGICSGLKSILGKGGVVTNEDSKKSQEKKPRVNSIIKSPVLYECNGEKLPIAEWSKRLGVAEATLRWRVRKYGSIELPKGFKQLFDYKEASIEKTEDGIFIKVDGRTWSLPEFAKDNGIKYHTLANRILKGKPINEILAEIKTPQRDYASNPGSAAKLWEWKGESHTAKEWADIYGVQVAMMRKRLNEHGSPERNCDRLEAYKANRAKRYEWNGEQHTIAEWSQITGKSESAIRSSLRKYGSPYVPPKEKKPKATVPTPVAQRIEDDTSDESDTGLYGFEGEWRHIGEWASEFGLTRQECKDNFLKYGEPTKPFIAIENETSDDDLDEKKIDLLLKEYCTKEIPRVNIKQWLEEIAKEPDDGTPLKDILGIKEHYHALDGIVPKRRTTPRGLTSA